MQVLFSSDFHLGHSNIHKFRTRFSSALENDQFILDQISQLNKRNRLYILGDFIFDSPKFESYLTAIAKMPCQIKLIMGNHCSRALYTQTIAPNIQIELPFFSYKQAWLSHCPIHPNEIRNRLGNIHGHLHHETLPDPRYFNVNIDVNDYKFVPLEPILTSLRSANEPNSRAI